MTFQTDTRSAHSLSLKEGIGDNTIKLDVPRYSGGWVSLGQTGVPVRMGQHAGMNQFSTMFI